MRKSANACLRASKRDNEVYCSATQCRTTSRWADLVTDNKRLLACDSEINDFLELLWLVRDGLLCEDGLAREKCLLAVVEMGVGGRRNHNRIDFRVTADCSGLWYKLLGWYQYGGGGLSGGGLSGVGDGGGSGSHGGISCAGGLGGCGGDVVGGIGGVGSSSDGLVVERSEVSGDVVNGPVVHDVYLSWDSHPCQSPWWLCIPFETRPWQQGPCQCQQPTCK